MQKHFVTFYSPGTFVAEMTERPIESWDPFTAVAMASSVNERYGAKPYGFRFFTRARDEDELDSRVVAKSGMYFLGGTILTLEDIKARNEPGDRILISNMESNEYKSVVENKNSWKWTQPMYVGDIVLDVTIAEDAPL